MDEPPRIAPRGRRTTLWFCVLAVVALLAWQFAHTPAVRTPVPPAVRDATNAPARPSRIDATAPSTAVNEAATKHAPVAISHRAHRTPQGLLPTLADDWNAQIPSLKAASDRGDASAAYALFEIFDACAFLPKLRKSPNIADQGGFVDKAEQANAHLVWEQHVAQIEASCRSIDAADIAQRQQWLERAAAGGDELAQTRYLDATLDVLTSDSGGAVRNAEAIVRAKTDGMNYLEQAAERGNTQALLELAIKYRTNLVVAPDPALSLGYAMAIQRTGLPDPIVDGVVDRWRANMTDAQIAQAEVHAQRIYASCCAP